MEAVCGYIHAGRGEEIKMHFKLNGKDLGRYSSTCLLRIGFRSKYTARVTTKEWTLICMEIWRFQIEAGGWNGWFEALPYAQGDMAVARHFPYL